MGLFGFWLCLWGGVRCGLWVVVSIFLFFFVIVFFVVWGRVSCRVVESSFIWVRLCVRELVVGGSVFGEIRWLEEFRLVCV